MRFPPKSVTKTHFRHRDKIGANSYTVGVRGKPCVGHGCHIWKEGKFLKFISFRRSLSLFAPGDFFISRSDALLALAFFSFYFVWEDMVVGGFSYFEKEV